MAKTNPQSSRSIVASSCSKQLRTPKSQSPEIKIKIESDSDSETGPTVKERRPLLKIIITRDRNASKFASYNKGACLFITPDMWYVIQSIPRTWVNKCADFAVLLGPRSKPQRRPRSASRARLLRFTSTSCCGARSSVT